MLAGLRERAAGNRRAFPVRIEHPDAINVVLTSSTDDKPASRCFVHRFETGVGNDCLGSNFMGA
jgi:hypothetical protein